MSDIRDYYTQLAKATDAEGLLKLRGRRLAETSDLDGLITPAPREHKVQENPLDLMYLQDASDRSDPGPKLEKTWGGPIRNPLGVQHRSSGHPHPSSRGRLTPFYGGKKRTRSLSEPTPSKKQRKKSKRFTTLQLGHGEGLLGCLEEGDDLLFSAGKEECCTYCKKKEGPLEVCIRCRTEAYCSTDCSSTHWKWHKDTCKPWSKHWDRDLHRAQIKQDLPQTAHEDSPCCTPADIIIADHVERGSADRKGRHPSFNPLDVEIVSFKQSEDNRRFQYALQTPTGLTWIDGAKMTGPAWDIKLNDFYEDLEDDALLIVHEFLECPPRWDMDPGIFKGRFIVRAQTLDDRNITFDVREPQDYTGGEGWLDGDALGPE